jgi:tRNA(Ile)-lysidine synthase
VTFSAALLRSLLEKEFTDPLARSFCVAFSGGVDSMALLAALAELSRDAPTLRLRAIHVDHGLQESSADWARKARQSALTLAVTCEIERIAIDVDSGESVEAAARAARYAVFRKKLQPDEILLTAHHQDDQLETVLLQLARGAGVPGLAAMPANAAFGAGRHVRPLLGVTRAALLAYARAHKLEWIEDPMNADPRFERAFLRSSVIPTLRKRWPGIAANVSRTARHMADAQELLDELAQRDWVHARDGDRLELASLAGLGRSRALNLLRYWIRGAGRPLPSADNLERLLSVMTRAAEDAVPRLRWPGADVRRYRGRLYLAESYELPALEPRAWAWSSGPLDLGAGLGSLNLAEGRGVATLARARLPASLDVRGEAAGASLRPAAGARKRTLRNLHQEHGVVPWARPHIPLLYAGRDLVAVGDLWTDAKYQPAGDEPAVHIEWHGRPELF